jgi:hypothetical protein
MSRGRHNTAHCCEHYARMIRYNVNVGICSELVSKKYQKMGYRRDDKGGVMTVKC